MSCCLFMWVRVLVFDCDEELKMCCFCWKQLLLSPLHGHIFFVLSGFLMLILSVFIAVAVSAPWFCHGIFFFFLFFFFSFFFFFKPLC
jgi:hypothetical protein